jgi:hypothetical protein
MSKIVTTDYAIDKIAAPSLPLAPRVWDAKYADQLNSVLRLYFNRLDDFIARLKAADDVPALTNYTVATLPSAATAGAGARSFVTNALTPVFGSNVVGGGTVNVPVYSDGTNWKVG